MLRKTLGLCALVAVAACDGNIAGAHRNAAAAEHPIRRNGGSVSTDSLNRTTPSTTTAGTASAGEAGNGTLGSGY